MGVLPERLRRCLPSALLLLTAAGGTALLLSADRLLAALYNHWRPGLEQQIGAALGHPLQLGPYRGLGVDGLRLGPSRLLPTAADRSSLQLRQLRLGVDPWASWRQGLPVLDLGLEGSDLQLVANPQNQWWVFGSGQSAQPQPRLALQLRFLDPLRLRLTPRSPQGGLHPWLVSGRGLLLPHRRTLHLRLQAQQQQAPGQVALAGRLQWQPLLWRGDLQLRQLPLTSVRPLLPSAAAFTAGASGQLQAQLALDLGGAQSRCQGQLRLEDLRWRFGAASRTLLLPLAVADCRDGALQVQPAAWRFGPWQGQLAGRLHHSGALQVQLAARQGRTPLLQAQLRGHWRQGGLTLQTLAARRGRSQLLMRGRLSATMALQGSWTVRPADLTALAPWAVHLGPDPLQGQLQLAGSWRAPRLALQARQQRSDLLGPWQLALAWQEGQLQLQHFRSASVRADAVLPLQWQARGGWRFGALQARLQRLELPLSRLNPLLGTQLRGALSGHGVVQGPLQRLQPVLQLSVHQPGVGPLQLQETWRGTFRAPAVDGLALGGAAVSSMAPATAARHPGAALLQLHAAAAEAPGQLQVRFDAHWQPVDLQLQRGDGRLHLHGLPRSYRWQAQSLPLHGLAVALRPGRPLQPLAGRFSGSGVLQLQPLAFNGRWQVQEPDLLGLNGHSLQATMAYSQRRYRLQAQLQPRASGPLQLQLQGRWQGALRADLKARQLSLITLRQLAAAWPLWLGQSPGPLGPASALGALEIDTGSGTLQDQLQALAAASQRLQARATGSGAPRASLEGRRLAQLQGSIDADLQLVGARLERLQADLQARGHLWLAEDDQDQVLATAPFTLSLQGPLRQGSGQFSLSGLPLALIALLTPVPDELRGLLAARGRYQLGGSRPGLNLELALVDAALATTPLQLERGSVTLAPKGLALDLALRSAGASSSVDLVGLVPLDPQRTDLELRLASRGDGLRFLAAPVAGALDWQRGSADLQLLVRGSLQDPIANGFLRLRDGEARLLGQPVRQLEATVLFDFQQLVVQSFAARMGERGQLRAEGRLGLVRPGPQDNLALRLTAVPVTTPRFTAQADGQVQVGGSLAAPLLAGDLRLSRGVINAQPAGLVAASTARTASSVRGLLEARWDFRQPLVLQSQELEGSAGDALLDAVPRLSWLGFDGLRLRLGPDLRVVLAQVANFQTGGLLRLQGRLDPSLRATGVVRLLGGRLNLFTTTFSLDPDTPNVAVFAPSLGLVPYLDIALRTRVADNLQVLAPSGIPNSNAAFLREAEGVQGLENNRFNLVQVTVSVSGPADRLAENLRLRSNPPLPQERLVALIGGNALAGLSGGAAGTALATVLGQSLLSPLLSGLSDAFGQRVSLALYPTYFNQVITDPTQLRSGRVPPRLVLGSEIGLDLSDRFNASVLAAPNQTDLPPQLNLRYKASNALSLEGSVDTQGSWQTQMQVFFRF